MQPIQLDTSCYEEDARLVPPTVDNLDMYKWLIGSTPLVDKYSLN